MYQKLVIVGNLGRGLDLRYTPSGTAVTTLSMATNRNYKGADGQQVKETTWWRVSVFGKTAEACAQYLDKGSRVLVEGRMVPDRTTGGPRIWKKQDGEPGASFEVFATEVRFLGGSNGNGGGERAESAVAETTEETVLGAPVDDQDSMPF